MEILALDIQIPPEVWCLRYVFRVQTPSPEVFGCLGWLFNRDQFYMLYEIIPYMQQITRAFSHLANGP